MAKSQKEKHGSAPIRFAHLAFSELSAPGRRGIRIFGLPREQLVMVTIASILLGIPLAVIVAMMPFWDQVGDFALLMQLNSYVAPAVYGLTHEYRAEALPRFPLRRFLIASTSVIELIILFNFAALFARGVRRHALLVWTCCGREKIFQYFGISCLIFCSLWYVLFFNWEMLAFLATGRRSGGLFAYLVMAMPIVTVVFGHMATIVGLGGCRIVSRKLRRLRKVFYSLDFSMFAAATGKRQKP